MCYLQQDNFVINGVFLLIVINIGYLSYILCKYLYKKINNNKNNYVEFIIHNDKLQYDNLETNKFSYQDHIDNIIKDQIETKKEIKKKNKKEIKKEIKNKLQCDNVETSKLLYHDYANDVIKEDLKNL